MSGKTNKAFTDQDTSLDLVSQGAPTSKSDKPSKLKPEYLRRLEKRVEENKSKIPVQLPIWHENRRGMPNTFLRSALFTCRRHNDERDHYNDIKLASTSDFDLFYTGLELSQDDEDLYMEIVHRSRYTPLGEVVTFSGYELLKSLGWGTSSRDYKRLQNGIHRLKGGTLKIVINGVKGYAGSLIRKYSFDEADTDGRIRYKIWLEPELVSQFQDDNYTQLKYEQRQRLGKANLAKWLHSYYSTHSEPFGLKTLTIRDLSSSDTKSLSRFRYQCKEAHDRLVDVGLLKAWEYNTRADIFKVERS
jgi:hypothetical protein